jgi:alanyl-tRNA synthetase
MGLERLAAVMQGVQSNYDIDLFRRLIDAIAKMADGARGDEASLKVIADHIRSSCFLISDGVMPSNEGRGYVLRRIIRRAARHGHRLGLDEPFFHRLVAPLADEMGAAYPELVEGCERLERVLRQEEERFAETLDKGLKILEQELRDLSGSTIPGRVVFELYDTYGFPVDLTNDIARERGLDLDLQGFDAAMDEQRARARAASQFAVDYSGGPELDAATTFTGYEALEGEGEVLALIRDGAPVQRLEPGDEGAIVLDATPFYAESGGQVGDAGRLERDGAPAFEVVDTQKSGAAHLHLGRAQRAVQVGDRLRARVDAERRQATVLNHSATHLMHAALRAVLGEHVEQKGSLVTPERLRFDFSHPEPMSEEQIARVEDMVNAQIRRNAAADARVMSMDQALQAGALALFGEKYGDEVRVLRLGFSTELCGGTHVERLGDIGLFKVVAESGIASGVRRIEAVTGANALRWVDETAERLERVAHLVKGTPADAEQRVEQLVQRQRALEKELAQLKARLAASAGRDLAAQAVDIDGLKVLAAELEDADPKALRETVDQLKDKLGQAAVLLATVREGKVSLVAGVSKDQTQRIRAGDLVNAVAQQVGGRGGGRPDLAQAGGNDPSGLDAALRGVPDWVRAQLG